MCSDNKTVTIDNSIIAHEGFGLLEDFSRGDSGSSEPIPLSTISPETFKIIIRWCTYHKDDDRHTVQEIQEWDQQFIDIEWKTMADIIQAANYLQIKPLLDVGCQQVARMIRGKTPAEIQSMFNISNNFESTGTAVLQERI
ncbi:Skp1-domain-containing protein [Obba rivulosa]|uniref:E3 ubiquitin ligase complex SCF subunit n=1 Tax=Obba rivulosa TaxID=1052685 RepID=A0A8E2DPK8_9APHY|nr:Skp1-domain-containing protein [Obba rivulosa]